MNKPTVDIDDLTASLLSQSRKFTESEVEFINTAARDVIKSQPMLLELSAPVFVCGDIHGQFSDLLQIFKRLGKPGGTPYLFLGDYVDRGQKSLETILLLFCFKVKFPNKVFLLRGNHECASINRTYGFFDEWKLIRQTTLLSQTVEELHVHLQLSPRRCSDRQASVLHAWWSQSRTAGLGQHQEHRSTNRHSRQWSAQKA